MAKKTSPENPALFDDLPEEAPREQIARITFKGWKKHLQSLQTLEKEIEALIDEAVKKALARGGKLTQDDIGRIFQRHPEIRRDLENAINQLNKELKATIEQGSKEAWLRANETGSQVAATLAASNAQLAALLAQGQDRPQNERALQAFMKRKQSGMNLSDRVWKTTMGMKLDMERAIDVALAEGTAADKLSQRIRHLLHEPHRLYRRVRDSKGNLRLSSAAQKYHPGTGVYRSSYMNAMRVARTEVNMAYQTSDAERWTKSWWVKGIRVSLSNNHTTTNGKGEKEPLVDICDELKGDYPPDFKFTGWHPQCRCFATAITCDYDEIREYYRRKRAGEDMSDYKPKGLITEPPANFKRWLIDNQERLAGAAERGTTPYFITNNQKYVTGKSKIQTQAPPKKTPLQIADERHAKRSPNDEIEIRRKWENRKTYIRLKDDPNYTDVKFNPENGGMMATHTAHNFDKDKGWYEKEVQKLGYQAGHSVILEKEFSNVLNQKFTEGEWDGIKFELATRETGTANNILRGLKHCAAKPKTEIAVLFFPEKQKFNMVNFEEALRRYKSQAKMTERTYIDFKRVICLTQEGIIYDRPL